MIFIFFKGSRKWTLKETMFSSMWGYWPKSVYLALEGQTLRLGARGLGLKAFGWRSVVGGLGLYAWSWA